MITENDILFAFGIGAALFMAIFIGANDVANAMGPLIGTKSISMFRVLLLAAIFESIGCIFLGGFVSNTVSHKLIHVDIEHHGLSVYMSAMISVLFGSGTWLCIATLFSLPVSTTHSVVGSIVGVGVFMSRSWSSVDWRQMGQIAMTWVASPLIGAVTSMVLWYGVRRWVVVYQPHQHQHAPSTTTTTTTSTSDNSHNSQIGHGAARSENNDGVNDDALSEMTNMNEHNENNDNDNDNDDQMNQMSQLERESMDDRSIRRMILLLPFFSFATVSILLLFLVYKGLLTPFNMDVPFYVALPISTVLSLVFALMVQWILVPRVKNSLREHGIITITGTMSNNNNNSGNVSATNGGDDHELMNEQPSLTSVVVHQQQRDQQDQAITVIDNDDDDDDDGNGKSRATSNVRQHEQEHHENEQELDEQETKQPQSQSQVASGVEVVVVGDDAEKKMSRLEIAEKYVFHFLVVMTSACIAVSHGANDCSNASGPLMAIYHSYSTGKLPDQSSNTKLWIILLTALGLVFGLATLGHKVMRTIGSSITKLTPARAFVSQLSTATITLTASLLGMPLSTTHIVVGCIYGIGIIDDYRNLKWRLIAGIIASWVITIPGAALLTLGFFMLLKLVV